jgi:hypothetical protein
MRYRHDDSCKPGRQQVQTLIAMPMLALGIFRLLVLVSKFQAGKEARERAFRYHCAGMLARALPLRLVEENVRSTHWAVIEG